MVRTAFLAVALVVVSALPALAQPQPPAGALVIPGPDGPITVACVTSGTDLVLTASLPSPVTRYLTPQAPTLSLTFFLDVDNDVKSGYPKGEDARRGADYSIDLILRRADNEGQPPVEDVTVAQYKSDSSIAMLVPAKSEVKVEGNAIEMRVPLAAVRLRKGQSVRVAAQTGPASYLDQTIELK